jgi:hypothetical protein
MPRRDTRIAGEFDEHENNQEALMEITTEQIESARCGNVVRIQTEFGEFVLLKAEMYDLLARLSYDDFDARASYPAVLRAWDAEGSPNDATDYQ